VLDSSPSPVGDDETWRQSSSHWPDVRLPRDPIALEGACSLQPARISTADAYHAGLDIRLVAAVQCQILDAELVADSSALSFADHGLVGAGQHVFAKPVRALMDAQAIASLVMKGERDRQRAR
jgi:hypothetical protein